MSDDFLKNWCHFKIAIRGFLWSLNPTFMSVLHKRKIKTFVWKFLVCVLRFGDFKDSQVRILNKSGQFLKSFGRHFEFLEYYIKFGITDSKNSQVSSFRTISTSFKILVTAFDSIFCIFSNLISNSESANPKTSHWLSNRNCLNQNSSKF